MSEREPEEEAVVQLPNGWEARRFRVGEWVKKDSGDYTFEGEIVSIFRKKSQKIRVVVEDGRGLCFIFNQNQLERVERLPMSTFVDKAPVLPDPVVPTNG